MHQTPREQQAEREAGHTTFSRGVPVFLTGFLLCVLLGVLLLERVSDADGGEAMAGFMQVAPRPTEIADTVAREGLYEGFFTLNARMLGNIQRLEIDLEHASPLRTSLLAPMNHLLTVSLGARNADVIRGREGWLFYEPAVQHVTGPGFLSDRAPRQGDPLSVLTAFHTQLAARGINLVVVPIPVKASIYPERLSGACDGTEPLQNSSQGAFLAELAARGVLVCDLTPALMAAKAEGPVFMARDSHWSPEGMRAAARQLGAFVRDHVPHLPTAPVAYRAATPHLMESAGDLAMMLSPDRVADPDLTESVMHQPVEGPDGVPWAADSGSAVLLLGDSFANIYAFGGMGWGEHGGLAAWLSVELQQPLDSITQNGDGASATRLRLNQAIQRGDDRLAGKRVVVFAFSARELSLGDWKPGVTLAGPP